MPCTHNTLDSNAQAVDDLDALVARLASKRHAKAIMFVDNAGADVVLGMIPLARELLKRGTQVCVLYVVFVCVLGGVLSAVPAAALLLCLASVVCEFSIAPPLDAHNMHA